MTKPQTMNDFFQAEEFAANDPELLDDLNSLFDDSNNEDEEDKMIQEG